ncbi:Alpha/Beta hydrolase fold [Phytophthora cactorum]|nr:Alpha/Beta hydrolase fold [Phytophthora cactorum]
MKVPMKVPVVTSPGLTSDRHMEALLSTPKHFTEEHVHTATIATGINMEYMLETNADAQSPACRNLPEERLKWDAKKQGRNLAILTFDNRGVGGTDAPLGRYTTSQMAEDAISLLDHLGGNLHTLLAQTGVVKNTVSLNYPSAFLDRPIGDNDVRSVLERHYATLPNRHKPAGYKALMCQGLAVQTHYVSDERLEVIAKAGFPVLIVGSMRDILIPPEESVKLLQRLPGDQVRAFFFKNGGHGIDTQFAEEVADGLVQTMKRARL